MRGAKVAHLGLGQRERDDRAADAGDGPRRRRLRGRVRDPGRHAGPDAGRQPLPLAGRQARGRAPALGDAQDGRDDDDLRRRLRALRARLPRRASTSSPATLARGFVEFHRFTAISYKLPLVDALVGAACWRRGSNGLERAGHVRDKLSWLISYAETLRALTHHAAERCTHRSTAWRFPTRCWSTSPSCSSRRACTPRSQHVQDIAGGLLVTYPAPEDLDHPDYGAGAASATWRPPAASSAAQTGCASST